MIGILNATGRSQLLRPVKALTARLSLSLMPIAPGGIRTRPLVAAPARVVPMVSRVLRALVLLERTIDSHEVNGCSIASWGICHLGISRRASRVCRMWSSTAATISVRSKRIW